MVWVLLGAGAFVGRVCWVGEVQAVLLGIGVAWSGFKCDEVDGFSTGLGLHFERKVRCFCTGLWL